MTGHAGGHRRRTWSISFLLAAIGLLTSTPGVSVGAVGGQQPADQRPLRFDDAATDQVQVTADLVEPGFEIEPVLTGLSFPTVVRFSPDGRVFVAEKGGTVKVYSSLTDASPDTAVNLSSQVYSYWDRGLLGMVLHPGFPSVPYLYLLFAWDVANFNDDCPGNPGPTTDGCMTDGRLVRVEISPANLQVGAPLVLLEGNWCQQFPSHSTGSLEFGPEGALYVSAGDGASFNVVDYGQLGGTQPSTPTPRNPCGDPPVAVGGVQTPPTAEGGALRSQDLRTAADGVTFDGAVLRIDPTTGQAWPNNRLIGGDPADDRIIAYGLRNPFRMAIRSNGEIWIGDVGWGTWEEINRIMLPTGPVRNFGWPCYEGNSRQGGYDAANLNVCENLYSTQSAHRAPHYAYQHGVTIDGCPEQPGNTSAISGLAFYPGGTYPSNYDGALFFADYARACIWVMFPGTQGVPSATNVQTFATAEPSVGLYVGSGGDIFSVDHLNGVINRIRLNAGNQVPTAAATGTPESGPPPLLVNFNGSASFDPDGNPLTYAWDLDGDGSLDDAFTANTSWTYSAAGIYQVTLQVSDGLGGVDTDQVTINVGGTPNTPPEAQISTPSSSLTWKVNDVISFSGSGSDAEDGTIAASGMAWSLVLHHCAPNVPTDCHQHPLQNFTGSGGSFAAPDHDYPSHLELTLTVTDSGGLIDSVSVRLDPQTVILTFASSPTGLQLVVGATQETAPFTREVIVGSSLSLSAVSPQTQASVSYTFVSWSDGGSASHNISAPASATTYTAEFNGTPNASFTASRTRGRAPLLVNFDASASSDPDGDSLGFSWDLDGDGAFDDGTGPTVSFTYNSGGRYTVSVEVSDGNGGVDTAQSTIRVTGPSS